VKPWERYAAPAAPVQTGPWARYQPAQIAQAEAPQPDEYGTGQALLIGAGRGMTDTGMAALQRGAELSTGEGLIGKLALLNPATQAMILANKATGAAGMISDKANEILGRYGEESDLYQRNKDNLGTAGTVGEIGGRVVASLPLGAAGGGGVAGGIQSGMLAGAVSTPTRSDADTVQNIALGGAFGALIPGLIEGGKVTRGAVRKLSDWLRQSMPNVTAKSREQAAAQILREAAANPAALAKAANPQQFVPGTVQTLAEATDDVGIAGLHRTLQNTPEYAGRVAQMASQNNAARVDALRAAFGGADEAAAARLEAARNQATLPLLDKARKVGGVNIKPTVKLADRIIKSREGNDTVVNVVSRVRDILSREGMDEVQKLHNARQEIGNIIGGLSPEKEAGKAATRELLSIRQSLDAQIGKASPEFRQFLKQYAAMSREAGQVRMGAELLGKGSQTLDAVGNPTLSPAQFARAANDLDRVARAATGFRKETAERLMTPDQRAVTGAVRSDLDRVARLMQGKAPGSNTVQNAVGMQRLQESLGGDLTAPLIPGWLGRVMQPLEGLRRFYGDKTLKVVQDAMLDPARANQLLAKMPAAQRQQTMALFQTPEFQAAMQALSRYSAPATASVATGQ